MPFFRNSNAWARYAVGGWQLSGTTILQTGMPFNITNGAAWPKGDFNADGSNLDRPNAPMTPLSANWDRSNYLTGLFPASMFPVPTPGTNGNLGRNVYRGPGFAETDLSLAKTFRILERVSCQIRFDAFNAFNRVNLGNPVSDLSNSNFGRSMSADPPGFPNQSSTRVLINTLVNSYETHRIHRASCRAHAGSAVSRINSGTHHRPTRRRGSQYQNCRGPG